MKGLGPDIPAGIDPGGKSDAQFQKGLNQDWMVEAPVEEPQTKTGQQISPLRHQVDAALVQADKRGGLVGKDECEARATDRGTESGGGLGPPVALDALLLSALPDTTEGLDGLDLGPFPGRESTRDGGVLFNPGAEAPDALFRQLVPGDPHVCQEPAEAFELVAGLFEAVFGRDRPSGEAGGPGGDQALDPQSEGALGPRVHWPREVPEAYFDLSAEVL